LVRLLECLSRGSLGLPCGAQNVVTGLSAGESASAHIRPANCKGPTSGCDKPEDLGKNGGLHGWIRKRPLKLLIGTELPQAWRVFAGMVAPGRTRWLDQHCY